ncbi:MAG TPA: GAF domain-containing sensor histidine kinase [Solirubrobacteraceae bacterium]|nr:GAF domain-containing sensor histidine kinase [Solirubrobacteraceae bacterium]
MDRATQGILDVARSVLSDLDLDVVLDRVLSAAMDLTEARYAALGVLNESRSELARFLTRGIDAEAQAAIGALPRGRGVLGVLIEDPRPLRLSNVSENPRSYGFPHAHPPMHSFLGVPILIDGDPFGNLYLTEKQGDQQFTDEDEQAVVVLADFAAVAIDHARRYTGAREHRDELQHTVAALEATTQIARAVGGETDPEVVLELVAKRARALVSARTLLIELERGNRLEVAAAAGEIPAGLIGECLPLGDTVAEQAIRSKRTQRLEEELNRMRFNEHGAGHYGVQAEAGLVVPLIFRGRSHGVLLALDRLQDGPSFSTEDERLLESFAVSAAMSVATAQSVAAERQRQRVAAAEAERQRWARELHDDTLQSLSALRFGLSAARRSEQEGGLDAAVAQAVEQIEESIANLRALITDLRPAALDELGVQAALEALATRSARHGIEVDVSIDLAYESGNEAERLSGELETALYRITQEALTNATKHGRATRAVIEIAEDAQDVRLLVRDNGSGFGPEQDSEGFGLLGMQERVALLGGELQIDSQAGQGTVVRVRLPVRRREDAAAHSA